MNMQILYDEMKEILDYFGLKFSEMDKVTVQIEGNQIAFSYGGRSVVLNEKLSGVTP